MIGVLPPLNAVYCVSVIDCGPSAWVSIVETTILPLCPFACSMAALSCVKNSCAVSVLVAMFMFTATAGLSSAGNVPKPVSAPVVIAAPVETAPLPIPSTSTYLLVTGVVSLSVSIIYCSAAKP